MQFVAQQTLLHTRATALTFNSNPDQTLNGDQHHRFTPRKLKPSFFEHKARALTSVLPKEP